MPGLAALLLELWRHRIESGLTCKAHQNIIFKIVGKYEHKINCFRHVSTIRNDRSVLRSMKLSATWFNGYHCWIQETFLFTPHRMIDWTETTKLYVKPRRAMKEMEGKERIFLLRYIYLDCGTEVTFVDKWKTMSFSLKLMVVKMGKLFKKFLKLFYFCQFIPKFFNFVIWILKFFTFCQPSLKSFYF